MADSNKNPPVTGNYGQGASYSTLPNNGVNSSDNPVYKPPPEQTIQQPPSHPLSTPYSESELSQYNSVHPVVSIPHLTDVNAVKGDNQIYQYVKSQPAQVAEAITLSKSPPPESGLVDIYSNIETKNGVTTTTTITPGATMTKPNLFGEVGTATLYGKTFQTYNPGSEQSSKGGEAVSFLSMPFSRSLGEKNVGASANNIPETGVVDVLQFLPGLGSGLLNKGTELLRGVIFKDVVKPASKEITDLLTSSTLRNYPTYRATNMMREKLPSNIFERDIINTADKTKPSTSPPAIAERYPLMKNELSTPTGPSMPKTPDISNGGSKFTSTNINLGTGIGRTITKDGTFESLVKSKPSTPPTEAPKPTNEKEVSTGKGTVQIMKNEKPQLLEKVKQEQKPIFKEYPLQLGKSEVKTVIKPKATQTKADLLTQKYMQELQQRRKQKQEQSLSVFQTSETLQAFKQKQDQSMVYNQKQKTIFVSKPSQTQKQKQPQIFKQVQTQPQIFKQTFKQTQSQVFTQTTPTRSIQITKTSTPNTSQTRITPPSPPLNFEEKKKHQKKPKHISAKKLNFLGNASVSDVVGLTRRADITYGNKLTAKLTRQDISKSARGSFISSSISKPSKQQTKSFNLYQKITSNKKTIRF